MVDGLDVERGGGEREEEVLLALVEVVVGL